MNIPVLTPAWAPLLGAAARAAASGITPCEVPLTRKNLLAIAYIGVIGSAFTYFLWIWALRHTTPSRFAIGLTMNPMGAMATGVIILGEPITPGVWAGLHRGWYPADELASAGPQGGG